MTHRRQGRRHAALSGTGSRFRRHLRKHRHRGHHRCCLALNDSKPSLTTTSREEGIRSTRMVRSSAGEPGAKARTWRTISDTISWHGRWLIAVRIAHSLASPNSSSEGLTARSRHPSRWRAGHRSAGSCSHTDRSRTGARPRPAQWSAVARSRSLRLLHGRAGPVDARR